MNLKDTFPYLYLPTCSLFLPLSCFFSPARENHYLKFSWPFFGFFILFYPQCINTETIFCLVLLFCSFVKIIYQLKSSGILSFPFNIVSKIPSRCHLYVQFVLLYFFVTMLFVNRPCFVHSLLLTLSVASCIVLLCTLVLNLFGRCLLVHVFQTVSRVICVNRVTG